MNLNPHINSSSQVSDWLVFPKPNPQSRLRLFCFPYAGVGAIVYRLWHTGLPSQVELISLQYPGRENRLREAPFVSIQPLLSILAGEVLPFLDQPFAFFGHSLGALIAFELARTLRKQGAPIPCHLFLSSRRAAHLPERLPPIHILSDSAFAEAVQQRYNGIPAVIRGDPELMALFMPVLKADISALETYQYTTQPPFEFPISVYGGLGDSLNTQEELSAWQVHTSRAFSLTMFPGDHFYLQNQRTPLLQEISDDLKVYL